jgi:surface antigen
MRKNALALAAVSLLALSLEGAAAQAPYRPLPARPNNPPPYTYQQRDYRPRYDYGPDCRDQNATAGAVLGAVIGGLLGSQVGQGGGRTAATIGGIILGGVAGNAIARDMDCRDRPYAFRAYSDGFAGPIGRDYPWTNDSHTAYGTFRPTGEYRERGYICRDFEDNRFMHGRRYTQRGTACRQADGNWYLR